MNYIKYINKIASFYPIDAIHKNNQSVFYIDYENLPSTGMVDFAVVLGALEISKNYILHLNIRCNDGSVKIDTDISISGDQVNKDNLIEQFGISTGSFTIHPTQFNVSTGINFYIATLTLKDTNENIYDNSTTWFLTRPDPDNNKQ